MSKSSYTVVRKRRGRDQRYHAMLLHDPNSVTMCGVSAGAMVVATTRSAVDCDDCAAMIVDLIKARPRRG